MPTGPTAHDVARTPKVDRRDFITYLGAGTAALVARSVLAAPAQRPRRKPNIIVILADDLGYGDISCQGCRDIPTPHIDSIARNGVRFTNGYVSCPVCSPTRAGLMTGRYQQRFGHEFNTGPPAEATKADIGLPLDQITLADALKAAGYTTGVVGKWHLGMLPKFHPFKRGFDEFFGFLGGSHSYRDAQADKLNRILRGTEPVDEKEYLTDAFSREAVDFIDRHHDVPFFLYLAYNAVHTPMQASPKYHDRFANISDEKRRTYAAMLAAMDDGVGAVLSKLREQRIEDDTLVFFLNDNGGPVQHTPSSNAPLRGSKGTMYEGGIRVPFLAQWKSRLPAGTTYDQPVISLDIFPTAVAAAQGKLPQGRVLDGVDLLPYVTDGKVGPPHDVLFWRKLPDHALRRGKWKLVKRGTEYAELYDLDADVAEGNDLADQQPGLVKELSEAFATWDAQLAQPAWERPVRAAKPQKRAKKPDTRPRRRPGSQRRRRPQAEH